MSLHPSSHDTAAPRVVVTPEFDPQLIEIHDWCCGQQRVPDEMLEAGALRERLAAPPDWTPEISDENRHALAAGVIATRAATGITTRAAVLIPLVLHDDGIAVLLTRRTEHLPDHAGQIAFPGGRMDPGDADAVDTALRESFEEIGLARERVEVIGILPDYLTISGYQVTPVVALVDPCAELTPNDLEVAGVFEVPLGFLMDPANHEVRIWHSEHGQRRFYAMPYEDRFIWGATAGMLRNLYHLLCA